MTATTYTPADPQTFSRLVAEAAMELPPLTHANDSDFLRVALLQVIEAFWENYVFLLPQEAQAEFDRLIEADDGEKLMAWYHTHANFAEDPAAAERGSKVLEDIALKLPSLMKEQYASLSSTPDRA